ncbi:MAG: site-specific integrase [Armatimonadota bacterium]
MKGSVVKRPSGYYIRYDVYDDTGKRQQKWKSVKGSKRDAEKELSKVLHEINTGRYVDPSKMTVSDLMQQYLEGNEKRLAEKTHAGYEEKINNYINPHLGRVRLEKLNGARIDKFLKDIQESGRKNGSGVSTQTAHHCRAILRSAINWGIKKDVINILINPVTRSDSIKVKHEEMKILSVEESIQLADACQESIWGVPIFISLYTGLRQGECLGLHWSAVDLEAGTIKVEYSLEYVKGKLRLKDPKNETSRRTFEVTPEVVEQLKRHREVQKLQKLEYGADYKDNDLVCAMPNGSYMRGPTLTESLQEILAKSEIRRIRFHDLRHTHISISLAMGESIIRVSKRVGHANPSITLKRYSHCIPGDMGAPVQFADALKNTRKAK